MAGQIIPLYPTSGVDSSLVQGIPVSTVDPTDGQTLVYNSTRKQWEPAAPSGGVPTTRTIGGVDLSANRSLADIGAVANDDIYITKAAMALHSSIY